jgi:hypothetical protein
MELKEKGGKNEKDENPYDVFFGFVSIVDDHTSSRGSRGIWYLL